MANIFTAEACSHVYANVYTVRDTPNGPVRVQLPPRNCTRFAWKKVNGNPLCKEHLRNK